MILLVVVVDSRIVNIENQTEPFEGLENIKLNLMKMWKHSASGENKKSKMKKAKTKPKAQTKRGDNKLTWRAALVEKLCHAVEFASAVGRHGHGGQEEADGNVPAVGGVEAAMAAPFASEIGD